jgi:hypothetical protein
MPKPTVRQAPLKTRHGWFALRFLERGTSNQWRGTGVAYLVLFTTTCPLGSHSASASALSFDGFSTFHTMGA